MRFSKKFNYFLLHCTLATISLVAAAIQHQSSNFEENTDNSLIYQQEQQDSTQLVPNNYITPVKIDKEGYTLANLRYPLWACILIVSIWFVFTVFGISANLFVFLALLKSNRDHPGRSQNLVNYLIMNLAFADLVILSFSVPVGLTTDLFVSYTFWRFICKIGNYITGIVVTVSVLSVATITVDRFLSIFLSLNHKIYSRKFKPVIGLIWLIAIAACFLPAWYRDVVRKEKEQGSRTYCSSAMPEDQKKLFHIVYSILFFGIPLIIIVVSNLACWLRMKFRRPINDDQDLAQVEENRSRKAQKKVANMALAVITFFVFCWLPFTCLLLMGKFVSETRSEDASTMEIFILFSLFLSLLNSIANPVICALFNRDLKDEIRAVRAKLEASI